MMTRPLKPYIAVLLFESSGRPQLFSEDFVLLRAGSEEEARTRAEERGRAGETAFQNEAGETIKWTLRHVVDVAEVLDDDLSQDTDLYSRHFRDISAYEAFEPLLSGWEL
ncbi:MULTISPECIES: DUF4288 domain-containing protein [Thermomonosporaceae]|uniref:DUF4288 domain-containing protein n=1 Tax=Thermomonosporaceae TaxID=2012 RepID=UPI00255AC50D|nr:MULTISPECIES: DUF4288 domain-containing protein [Thermomonosporaceae]MDL4774990.1 DUF4288 domain-containing protein [Actinomadura xylanilytica]